MSIGNTLIRALNKPITRGVLEKIIFMRYAQRGKKIERVRYHSKFNAWEFRIGGISFLSTGPGWVYDKDYLKDQVRMLSGFAYTPTQGDVVVDVGAGVGEETIIYSDLVGQSGKVYAIEAHPKTYSALTYLIESNSLRNVMISNLALSDKAGDVSIQDSDNSLANSILQVAESSTVAVQSETFDEFVERNHIQTIDLLKMNVEGAEQLIIKGMSQSIELVKRVAISCHDFRYHQGESIFFKTKALVIEFLSKHDFEVSTQRSSIPMIDDYVYGTNRKVRD